MSVWQSKPFEECIEKVKYTTKIPRKNFLSEGAYPIISQEDGQINGYWNNADDLFIVDRPVVIFGDHTQILKYVEHDFVLGADGVKILKPKNFLDPRFFYYALTAQPSTTLGYARHYRILKEKTINYPPLREQQRIVAVLDEAFAGIAKATENAQKNLANARELFESHLKSIFTTKGDGWVEKPLGDLCTLFDDGDWIESKDQSESGIRLIQTGNVGVGTFKSRAEKARYISEETFARLKCTEIFEGDCLVSRLPDPVGRACIIPDVGEKMITAVDCTIIRFKPDKIIPQFFNYYAQSGLYLREVESLISGATRQRISRSNLGKVSVPVPPLPEQQRIVAQLDTLATETKRLEAIYQQKLEHLAALKQSILQKAFAGELHTDKLAA